MNFRWSSMLSGAGLLVSVLAGGAGPNGATPAGAGVSVGSDGSRVAVRGERVGGETTYAFDRISPVAEIVCRELITETNGLVEADATSADWPPLDPGRDAVRRYWLDCRYPDGTVVPLGGGGLGYVYADEIVDFDAIARAFAEQYAGETLGPALAIGTSPPQGLVGVEQWFWVQGYDGTPVIDSHDAVGHRVDVTLTLAEVRWDFGDGGEGSELILGAQGLGRPDAAGAVIRRYPRRSTGDADPAAGFPVAVSVELAVEYRLDGAGPFPVTPPVVVSATSSVVVREAQAVVHR